MLRHTSRCALVAALAGALACTDRPPTAPGGGPAARAATPGRATIAPPEELARALALALGAPEFRSRVKAQLDASPFRERSEEHTSELQSRLHIVCRLLLGEKNQRVL